MDIDQLEAEAQRLALQQVANMLQRPDQLEKVDQYKQRYVSQVPVVPFLVPLALYQWYQGWHFSHANKET